MWTNAAGDFMNSRLLMESYGEGHLNSHDPVDEPSGLTFLPHIASEDSITTIGEAIEQPIVSPLYRKRKLGRNHQGSLFDSAMSLFSFSSAKKAKDGIQLPADSKSVVNEYQSRLTALELAEMKGHKVVYYLPFVSPHNPLLSLRNRRRAALNDQKAQSGYPTLLLGDQIGFRYKILDVIDRGQFGLVVKCLDMKLVHLNNECLNKRLEKMLFNSSLPSFNHDYNYDDERCESERESALVAIKISAKEYHQYFSDNEYELLREMQQQPQNSISNNNVVQLRETLAYRGWECWVFPYYKYNWFDLVRKYEQMAPVHRVPLIKLRQLARDMVNALWHLKQHQIIHFDLKPHNILYDQTNDTSHLADFGLSAKITLPWDNPVGTPEFSAPEMYIPTARPSYSSDIWSLGATLFSIAAVQMPAFSHIDREEREVDFLTDTLSQLMHRFPNSLDYAFQHFPAIVQKSFSRSKQWEIRPFVDELNAQYTLYYYQDPDHRLFDHLVSFIDLCVHWNPRNRATVDRLLRHPFIN